MMAQHDSSLHAAQILASLGIKDGCIVDQDGQQTNCTSVQGCDQLMEKKHLHQQEEALERFQETTAQVRVDLARGSTYYSHHIVLIAFHGRGCNEYGRPAANGRRDNKAESFRFLSSQCFQRLCLFQSTERKFARFTPARPKCNRSMTEVYHSRSCS